MTIIMAFLFAKFRGNTIESFTNVETEFICIITGDVYYQRCLW